MRSAVFLSAVLLLSSLLGRPTGAQSDQPRLGDDPRLQAPVSISTPMMTIEDVLARIGEACKVPLTAAEAIRGDTVLVFVRDRPARQVLQQLSTTLGYDWKPTAAERSEPGYRLIETAGAAERSRLLQLRFRRAAAAEFDGEAGLVWKYVERYAGMSNADRYADQQELNKKARSLPISREQLAAEREYIAAQNATLPPVKALLWAFMALPAKDKDRLLMGERVVSATRRPSAVPMSPEVLTLLRDARKEVNAQQNAPVPQAGEWPEDDFVAFLTRFSRFQNGRLELLAEARRLPGPAQAPGMLLPQPAATVTTGIYGRQLMDDFPGQLTANRPGELDRSVRFSWERKKLDKDDSLTYCQGILAEEVVRTLATDPANSRFACIGDSFFVPLRVLPSKAASADGSPSSYDAPQPALDALNGDGRRGELPLRTLLAQIATRGNTNIHLTRDGWLRFRSVIYFEERPGQVDPETVKRLFKPVAQGRSYNAETAMAAARSLDSRQAQTLSNDALRFLPQVARLGELPASLDAWRVIGRLTEERRRDLFAGKSIGYDALTTPEQEAVRNFLRDEAMDGANLTLDLDVGARELASLTLRVPSTQRDPNLINPLPDAVPGQPRLALEVGTGAGAYTIHTQYLGVQSLKVAQPPGVAGGAPG